MSFSLSISPSTAHLAVCFHLGNYQLWPEMRTYLTHISRVDRCFDLYLSYQVENPILQQIKRQYPSAVLVNSTYGMDIGGQLLNLNNLFRSGKKYDLILFLHTKSRSQWRSLLIGSTCLFEQTIRNCIEIFAKEPDIGIIGSKYRRYNLQHYNFNHEYLAEYTTRWSLTYQEKDSNIYFIAGTIFWMRWSILDQFVKEKKVDFADEYAKIEKIRGRILNINPTRLHSWERIFGIITSHYGYRVHGTVPIIYTKMILPPDFNLQIYLEKNPDLLQARGIPMEMLPYHYYFFGRKEGRSYK